MSREELLSEMVASLRDQVEWQTKSAILAERERDQLRALLVEAMKMECFRMGIITPRKMSDVVWLRSRNFWWPPWFEDAARLIFQMRRGE